MELKIAKEGEWRPAVLGGPSGVHRDIMEGRDCEIGWEDVFVGKCTLAILLCFGFRGVRTNVCAIGNESRDVPDFHTEMEAKTRMNW
jgi:proteasome maturation protein